MNNPYLKIYRGDWFGDAALRSCPVEVRLVWLELMFMACDGQPYGYLRHSGGPFSAAEMASYVGASEGALQGALTMLTNRGVCSRDDDGALYSRRMVRDDYLRRVRAEGGKKGDPGYEGAHGGALDLARTRVSRSKSMSKGKNPPTPLGVDAALPGVAKKPRARKRSESFGMDEALPVLAEFPGLDTPAVRASLEEYLTARSRKHGAWTPQGMKIAVRKFEKLGATALVEGFERATERPWQTLFKQDDSPNGNGFHGKPKAPYVLPPLQSEFPV